MTTEQRPIGEAAPHPRTAAPEVLAALGALGRVARALVGSGSLSHLAERALGEMRDALGLELVVLYLPRVGEEPSLQRYISSTGAETGTRARDEVAFEDEAWRLAVASGAPLVFRDEASWLVPNPFEPPAQSWLVVPLVSEKRLVGVVVAAAALPLSLDPTSAIVLTLLGDLLAAGIARAPSSAAPGRGDRAGADASGRGDPRRAGPGPRARRARALLLRPRAAGARRASSSGCARRASARRVVRAPPRICR